MNTEFIWKIHVYTYQLEKFEISENMMQFIVILDKVLNRKKSRNTVILFAYPNMPSRHNLSIDQMF